VIIETASQRNGISDFPVKTAFATIFESGFYDKNPLSDVWYSLIAVFCEFMSSSRILANNKRQTSMVVGLTR
jgi:hypothetical protein